MVKRDGLGRIGSEIEGWGTGLTVSFGWLQVLSAGFADTTLCVVLLFF